MRWFRQFEQFFKLYNEMSSFSQEYLRMFDDGYTNWIPRKKQIKKKIETELFSLRKEGRNVLFNDALNTFYLRLYGVRDMIW